jgi:hypothetical protein
MEITIEWTKVIGNKSKIHNTNKAKEKKFLKVH